MEEVIDRETEVQEATNSGPSNKGVQLEGKIKRTIIKLTCVIVAELAKRKSAGSWFRELRNNNNRIHLLVIFS